MHNNFIEQLDSIAVAIAFDRQSVGLMQAGAELARRMGKKLCLLHIVEPWTELPHSRAFGTNDPLWNVTQAVERNARDLAEARLSELAAMVPGDVFVTTRVAGGKPTQCLGPEALQAGCCLLLVSADYGNMRFLPRGLSTAMSLLATSPVPVAVLDPELTPHIAAERTRILLADDLGPGAEPALEFAFSIGAALGDTELSHIHVNALTIESLHAGLVTAAASAHVEAGGTTASDVYEALMTGLRNRLEERATKFGRDYLEAARGLYTADIVTGHIAAQIGTVAAATQPHMMIFGRHHPHTKSFFIGGLPYRSMMAQHRPIIVVPNT